MLKAVVAAAIFLAPMLSHAAAVDCPALKIQAADTLSSACAAPGAELSPEQAGYFQEASTSLAGECADGASAETLERGILYKKLELTENCNAKAEVLALSK